MGCNVSKPISSEKELPTEPKGVAFTIIVQRLKVLRFGKRKSKHLETIPEALESPVQQQVRVFSLSEGSFNEPVATMLRPVDLPSGNTKLGGMVK